MSVHQITTCNSCGKSAKKLTPTFKNAFCNECSKQAIDNAFKTLQVSLSIDPETGKHSDEISKKRIYAAKTKMDQSNPLN